MSGSSSTPKPLRFELQARRGLPLKNLFAAA